MSSRKRKKAAAAPDPALKIEFETSANGKLGKSSFTVLDESGEVLHTDRVNPSDATDRKRAAREMSAALGRPLQDITAALNKACKETTKQHRRWREQAAAGSPEAAPQRAVFNPTDGRPVIIIGPEEQEVNDAAAAALAGDSSIYQRGGALVRVVRDASPASKGIRRPFAPRIDTLPLPILRERLASAAHWVTIRTIKGAEQACKDHPPGWSVAAVAARAQWPNVRHLEAVVDFPVLRPDGSILGKPGYDPETGLLLEVRGEIPCIPDWPTHADACAARDVLLEVVRDFPFERPMHRAAWLAGLLTPLARFAFTGPAPLFLIDSNVRGAGKGLLLHCLSRIVTGQDFTVASYTTDEDEMRKRITSLAMEGDRLVLFDNLEGRFGGPTLDAALTATAWKDRVLGASRMMESPLYITWFATGNNVVIGGDTARRTCHVRLESPEENPEERTDFAQPNLLDWVGQRRGKLLGAALTILRGYHVAGRPDMQLPAWGTFEGWSGLPRSAVVWAGLPDPGQTRALLQQYADTTAETMQVLLECWVLMDPLRQGMTCAQVIHALDRKAPDRKHAPAEPEPAYYDDMRAALEALLGKLDGRNLGNQLRLYRRRIFGGLFIDDRGGSDKSRKSVRWVVKPAEEIRVRTGGSGGSGGSVPVGADSEEDFCSHASSQRHAERQPRENDPPDPPDPPPDDPDLNPWDGQDP